MKRLRREIVNKKVLVIFGGLLLLFSCACQSFTLKSASAAGSGYNASDVLGQLTGGNPDFTTSNSGLGPDELDYPTGSTLDTVHHRLFVGEDGANYRVVEYDLDANDNLIDHTADHIIGQPNFASNVRSTTQNGGSCQYLGIGYDSTTNRLYVNDVCTNNNRVLVYDLSSGITDGMNASYVIGQPDFLTNGGNTTQTGLFGSEGLTLDTTGQRLFVADSRNNRVLVFNINPATITNGEPADHVLGQADFITSGVNLSQSGMNQPEDIAYNPVTKQLFVGDSLNYRILVFDLSSGVSDNMNATHVLGQPDFLTNTPNVSQNGMGKYEEGIGLDLTRNLLYLSDDENNRVVVFDFSNGITDNMNASMVLGQPDFTTATINTSQTGLNDPEGPIAVDSVNNRIYVTDSSNNRVMIFNLAKLTNTLPTPVLGTAYSQSLGSQTQGATTYSLVSGSLPNGLSLNASTGLLTGTPTKAGTFTFALRLVDNNGVNGGFTDNQSYTVTIAAGVLADTGTPIVLTTVSAVALIATATVIHRRKRIYHLRNYR